MRVWDVLFNEGANILFRVALAVFKVFSTACCFSYINYANNDNIDIIIIAYTTKKPMYRDTTHELPIKSTSNQVSTSV